MMASCQHSNPENDTETGADCLIAEPESLGRGWDIGSCLLVLLECIMKKMVAEVIHFWAGPVKTFRNVDPVQPR